MSSGGAAAEIGAARRLLTVAESLLHARDFIGSKKFAILAMESDPLLDGVDWIVAVSDVLLAATQRRVNYHVNWYEVLQIGASSNSRDMASVRSHYRRLALLLRPESRPNCAAADEAFKLVENAWKVLSDPVKKDLYDKELLIAVTSEQPNGGAAVPPPQKPSDCSSDTTAEEQPGNTYFWTACTNCFHIHQYARGCEEKTLICQSCRKSFKAKELQSSPPIVPGTDLYYCVWGLFPLGFSGDINLAGNFCNFPAESNPSISPFFPGFHPCQPAKNILNQNQNQNPNSDDQSRTIPAFQKPYGEIRKKAMVRRPTKQKSDAGIEPMNTDEQEKT